MFDFRIDNEQVVQALGIESSASEFKEQVVDGLQKALSERMWLRIQSEMSDQELETLDKLSDQNEAEAKLWLVERFPNYEAMYQEELTTLIEELRHSLDAIEESDRNKQ